MQLINSKFSYFSSKPILALVAIIGIGFALRIFFTQWQLPTESFDAFVFMNEGLNYSNGNFNSLSHRFLWPMFLSMFFSIIKLENNFEYMTLVRIISISLSSLTTLVVYFIAKNFVKTKYAIIAAILFSIEPNIIENSIFGITEPLFILLGLISFYFIIQKNNKFFILSFLFAGLAYDTRINGIILIVILIIISILRIKENHSITRDILVGFLILFIVIAPINIIYPILEGKKALPYVGDVVTTISSGQEYYSTYDNNLEPSSFHILQNAIKNTFMNFFRISIPYLILFFPIGIIIILKDLNYEKKIFLIIILFSILIAIPQHMISNEYRNLFFITPFLVILSALALQKFSEAIKMENIFLILIIFGIILISGNFLMERLDIDKEYVLEKDDFGKYIVNKIKGNITGDMRLEIIRNMPNLKITSNFSNEDITFFDPGVPINSVSKLIDYCKQNKINYIIIEYNKDKKHFPIFDDIIKNEAEQPFLEEVYDSHELGYKKLKIKIFKINFE